MNREELKKLASVLTGIADGKPWQIQRLETGEWDDPFAGATPIVKVYWGFKIRLKPWELGRTINGHTLPDGAEWHRQDFTEDMLPANPPHRPLMDGEPTEIGDEVNLLGGIFVSMTTETGPCRSHHNKCRTTRPIPFALTPEQIAAGWLLWTGGECPVEMESMPTVMIRTGYVETVKVIIAARKLIWQHDHDGGDIIAYRPDPYGKLRQALADGKTIQKWTGLVWEEMMDGFRSPVEFYREKPEPQWLPLCKTDIPPGSVLCPSGFYDNWRWFSIRAVLSDCVLTDGAEDDEDSEHITFQSLMRDGWQINRSIAAGKWDATAWEPCRKTS